MPARPHVGAALHGGKMGAVDKCPTSPASEMEGLGDMAWASLGLPILEVPCGMEDPASDHIPQWLPPCPICLPRGPAGDS